VQIQENIQACGGKTITAVKQDQYGKRNNDAVKTDGKADKDA